MTSRSKTDLAHLLDCLDRHQRLALSRLLSIVANGERLAEMRSLLQIQSQSASDSPADRAWVIALTGGGGVGKSTLIGKLVGHIRQDKLSVAVLACDPSSSLTGGALLGDRIRIPTLPDDPELFIRSLAVPSGHQAVAENLDFMVRLLERFGFDFVLIETVGAGQGDTAVRDVADVVVLLVQPDAGDQLQWEKAGVLEIADLVVVNKADLPGSERVERELREMLNLQSSDPVPVQRVSGARDEGVDQLWHRMKSLCQQ